MPSTWRTGPFRRAAHDSRDVTPVDTAAQPHPARRSDIRRIFWPAVFVLAAAVIGVVVGREGLSVASGALAAGVLGLAATAWRQDQLPRREQLLTLAVALPVAVCAAWTTRLTQTVDAFEQTRLDGGHTAVLRSPGAIQLSVDGPPPKDALELELTAQDTLPNAASCVDVGQLRFESKDLRNPTKPVDLRANGSTTVVLKLNASSQATVDVRLGEVDKGCEVELTLKSARFT